MVFTIKGKYAGTFHLLTLTNVDAAEDDSKEW